MKRVLTALVLIPIVLVIVFLGPKQHWLFSFAVAGVATLAGWEYLGLTQQRGARPPRIAVIVALLTLFLANFEWPDRTPDVFGLLTLALLILCTFRRPVEQVMADTSACTFCMFYIGFTLLTLISLHEQPNGPSLVV